MTVVKFGSWVGIRVSYHGSLLFWQTTMRAGEKSIHRRIYVYYVLHIYTLSPFFRTRLENLIYTVLRFTNYKQKTTMANKKRIHFYFLAHPPLFRPFSFSYSQCTTFFLVFLFKNIIQRWLKMFRRIVSSPSRYLFSLSNIPGRYNLSKPIVSVFFNLL